MSDRSSRRHLFTSEAVAMGHPDKIADQISDAVLDAIMADDPQGRVACETMVTTGLCVIAGEITTNCYVDIPAVARETIHEIGYTDASMGFDYLTCGVVTSIDQQSSDISQGVSEGSGLHKEQGAGDQGIMFGYACNETEELMPLPIHLARELVEALARARQERLIPWLRPDGKSQVTVEYEDGKPVRVHTVVVSTQHEPDIDHDVIQEVLIERVVHGVIPAELIDDETIYHVNPTGRFVIGGPQGDCGLTGRKIIVDTYGGMGSHGGGCFSGKDPTKVDRSASYAARHAAKNIVGAGLADKCEVQLAYAIGIAQPLSILVDCQGTAKVSEGKIEQALREQFDFSPRGMIERLKLRRPIYKQTARHGHFGRKGQDYTWERLDMVDVLKKATSAK